MPTMAELREGLRARLDTIPNVQASAYLLASPTPPAAHVIPGEITYDMTFARGADYYEFKIQVFAGYVSDLAAQKKLDLMLNPSGATSVKAAVEGDRTLGGMASDAHVKSASSPMVAGGGDRPPVLMAEWLVEVIA